MEEALRQSSRGILSDERTGFNPCFNGRGVKTENGERAYYRVNGFNPCFNGRGVKTSIIFFY